MKEKGCFISETIKKHYLPGTISNYDFIINMSDLSDLFAPIHGVTPLEIKESLNNLGFSKESRIDDGYFVKINL